MNIHIDLNILKYELFLAYGKKYYNLFTNVY